MVSCIPKIITGSLRGFIREIVMTEKSNKKPTGKQRKGRKTPELIWTPFGERPNVRDDKNKLVSMVMVGEVRRKGKLGHNWLPRDTAKIPNCDTLAGEIETNMLRDTAFRPVNQFIDNGLSEFYSANPNLVIDSMQILMEQGLIERADFDEVFDQVYPFSEVEWVVDEDYETYQWKAYQNLTNSRAKGYPPKGERTETDFKQWLKEQPLVYVKSWKGKVTAYGREFNTQFAVSKIDSFPGRGHPATGLSNYFVGNRAMGGKPILKGMLMIPGTAHSKYIRGLRSKTNMAAYPRKRQTASERKKVRQQKAPTMEENFGSDPLARLMAGETVTN